MRVWRNLFFSFVIFAGIFVLSLLIPRMHRDWQGRVNEQQEDAIRDRLSNTAILISMRIQTFYKTREAALLSMAQYLSELETFSRQDFVDYAAAMRQNFGGVDSIQYVKADRSAVWDYRANQGAYIKHSTLLHDNETFAWLSRVRDTALPARSELITLQNGERAVAIPLPVITESVIDGWLLWSISIDTLMGNQNTETSSLFILAIEYYESRADGTIVRELHYGEPDRLKLSGDRVGHHTLLLGNIDDPLRWIVKLGINPESEDWYGDNSIPSTSPILLLGLLISVVSGVFTFLILTRNDKLAIEVAERVYDVETSQQELRSIIENAPMAILGYDKSHRIMLWNPMCTQIFGYTRQEAEGRMLDRLAATHLSPDTREKLFTKAFEGERIERLMWHTQRKDGESITCGGSCTTIDRGNPDQKFVLLVCNDITEQRRLEAEIDKYTQHLEQVIEERTGELAESEARHRQLLSTAKDAIIGIDDKQKITLFNIAAERSFGYTAQEILGQPIWTLLPRSENAGSIAIVEPFLSAGETQRIGLTREMRGRKKNGEIFPVEISLSVFTQKGIPHYTAIVRDISDRKEIDERIEHMIRNLRLANQEMEDFTYVVSHDLKAPLRAVKNMSQFLSEDFEDKLDEKGHDYLNRLQESVKLMSELIDDLLELSHISQMKSEDVPVSSEALVEKAISILKPGTNVQIRYARDLPTVSCTPAKLEQVFLNLINNGIKYNDKSEVEIEIGCQEKEHEFVFYVKDNGIGIDKKYQYRIFQPFQRLHKRNEYEGTGIGLTIAKKVIQDHGGRIWMHSEIGKGTTFYFSIPKTHSEALVT